LCYVVDEYGIVTCSPLLPIFQGTVWFLILLFNTNTNAHMQKGRGGFELRSRNWQRRREEILIKLCWSLSPVAFKNWMFSYVISLMVILWLYELELYDSSVYVYSCVLCLFFEWKKMKKKDKFAVSSYSIPCACVYVARVCMYMV